jgi:hypothetical protein
VSLAAITSARSAGVADRNREQTPAGLEAHQGSPPRTVGLPTVAQLAQLRHSFSGPALARDRGSWTRSKGGLSEDPKCAGRGAGRGAPQGPPPRTSGWRLLRTIGAAMAGLEKRTPRAGPMGDGQFLPDPPRPMDRGQKFASAPWVTARISRRHLF